MSFQQTREKADRVRSVPLTSVLLTTGASQDRYDKAKWHTAQGVISVTGVKFMNWTCGVGGGGAIDLVIHLNSQCFKDAVEWLDRRFSETIFPQQADIPTNTHLRLPPPDSSRIWRIKRYLVSKRAITPALVTRLIDVGTLYADNRSNAVFKLLGKEKMPVGAEIRGTGPWPWRGMAYGSKKDLGFFSISAVSIDGIILCESAIDTISCFILSPRYHCVSTAGARPNPRWLPQLIQQGKPVYCGFDADQTGENMARTMISLYPSVKRLRPSKHDWNDVLKSQS